MGLFPWPSRCYVSSPRGSSRSIDKMVAIADRSQKLVGGLSYEVWTPGALLCSFGSLALSHANCCSVHFASLTCRSGGQRAMWLKDRHQLKGGSSISPRCVWLKNIVIKLKRGAHFPF